MTRYIYWGILLLTIVSCVNNNSANEKLKTVINLIQEQKISEADSLYNSIKYDKSIDFNYYLIDVIIKFKYSKFKSGLTSSQSFIKKYPRDAFGYYYAGLCEFNLAHYENAETFFSQAFEKFNQTPNKIVYIQKKSSDSNFDQVSIYDDLVFMTGLTNRFLGKFKTAINYLETCINKAYKVSEAYLIIGDCYSNLGDKVNARRFYQLALQFGNKDAQQFLDNL